MAEIIVSGPWMICVVRIVASVLLTALMNLAQKNMLHASQRFTADHFGGPYGAISMVHACVCLDDNLTFDSVWQCIPQ